MDIQISVRNLVEFIFREGDIDNRHAASPDAMQDGSRIHRMIQKRMGLEYEAEVPLRYIVPYENYQIQIEGRADGVIHRENGQVIVDEIKGTYQELKHIREPKKVHLMQALCYAFIVAEKEDLREIGVRMTYCNMDTEEIKYFHETYTRVEVRNWFWNLMNGIRSGRRAFMRLLFRLITAQGRRNWSDMCTRRSATKRSCSFRHRPA